MVTVTDRDTDMRGMVEFILEGGGGTFRVRPRRVDNRQTWGGEIIVARGMYEEVTNVCVGSWYVICNDFEFTQSTCLLCLSSDIGL